MQVNQNQALYSLIGVYYGGTQGQTFAFPDLRGRVVVGRNQVVKDYVQVGTKGGVETVTLTAAQMPTHGHQFAAMVEHANAGGALGNYVASAGTNATITTQHNLYAAPVANGMISLNPGSIQATGGGAAHANIQPLLATNFYICVSGLYPMREDG
ncbi:Phage tail protein [Gammaproteobacteria bacterium]